MAKKPIPELLEAIRRLSGFLRENRKTGWLPISHFSIQDRLTISSIKIDMTYRVMVLPPGSCNGIYCSSVIAWNARRKKMPGLSGNLGRRDRPFRKSEGWNPVLLRLGWYRDFERLLNSYGYRGQWMQSPWGRFGDFWKKHKNAAALEQEIATLEDLRNDLAKRWGNRK